MRFQNDLLMYGHSIGLASYIYSLDGTTTWQYLYYAYVTTPIATLQTPTDHLHEQLVICARTFSFRLHHNRSRNHHRCRQALNGQTG